MIPKDVINWEFNVYIDACHAGSAVDALRELPQSYDEGKEVENAGLIYHFTDPCAL